jgi:hypothetical protein
MTKSLFAVICLSLSVGALAAESQPPTTAAPATVQAPAQAAPAQEAADSMPLLRIIGAGAQTNSAHAEGALVAVAGFAFTLLIVLVLMAFRRAQEHERYETIRRLVEKGAEIPKELLGVVAKEGSDFRRGVVFISLGVGFAVLYASGSGWGVGALFVCLGLGYLAASKMEKKKV